MKVSKTETKSAFLILCSLKNKGDHEIFKSSCKINKEYAHWLFALCPALIIKNNDANIIMYKTVQTGLKTQSGG